ncbi:5924_t:CDS:2 [Entrophospora sp. SA101]|nr:5924_t:CDS:2 [Entrophospora sp. SA101]
MHLEKERNELLEKIKELEARVEEKDNIIENLEERVDMEVEMNLKALDKSKEYHDRNLFLLGMSKDTIITNLKLKIQELEKNQKVDRVKQLRKLENKAKTKVKERT